MWLCCVLGAPLAAAEPRVVFDVDLTKGNAGPGKVAGGAWDDGWRCTGAKDERIVYDAGGPIANGSLEASFTISELPWASQQGKINYIGLHEDASLSQNKHDADLFYARTGNVNYKFSNVKAAGRRFDRGEHEPRVGSADDWIADGKTVHTIKLQWQDGVPIFHDTKGRATVFPRDVIGGNTPVDRLRYVFLGSDHYTGLTVKGLRFLRVKLTDDGPDAAAPPPERLKISDNGHFLVAESGRPVFLLCDTAWGLVNRLKRDEIEEYLRHRRGQRFNAVAFVLYVPANLDIADGIQNIYGQTPFQSHGRAADVKQPRTTAGANPASAGEYDFWDHVDYTIQLTKRLGMFAVVLPCWGSAVVGDYGGKASGVPTVDAPSAAVYGRWLGERYGQEPHVVWMLGGDRRAIYGERDFRPVFQAMAKGVADGGAKQLMSYHPPKKSPQSGDWFHHDAWLSFNSSQHWPEDQLATIARDWQLSPTKPTWLFEGRYEGYWKNNYKPQDWGEWQCRQQAWQTVVAGAFGHTYGHERVFGFGKDGADWKAALDAPGARSMTHLAKLMNYLGPGNMLGRQPDQSLLAGEEGKAERLMSDRITVSRTANKRCVLAYTAAGRPIRLHLDQLAQGPLFGWWFNPRTGGWHADGSETAHSRHFAADLSSGPGAPVREFDPPGESGPGQDWVLVLSASEGL
jgi:hypothetical protein